MAQSHRTAKGQPGFKLRGSFLRAHILNPCAIVSSCSRMISALIFSAHLSVTWPGRSSIARRPGHLTNSPFSWLVLLTDLFHCTPIDQLMILNIRTVLITLFYLCDFSFCLGTFSVFGNLFTSNLCVNQPPCPVGSRAIRMDPVSPACLREFWNLLPLLHPCSSPLRHLSVLQLLSLGLTSYIYLHTSPTGLEDKKKLPSFAS